MKKRKKVKMKYLSGLKEKKIGGPGPTSERAVTTPQQ
jgi:hypothetical protein